MKTKIYSIICVAFVIRLILLFIDQFWTRLPQGGLDTENFDFWAYDILKYGSYSFLETISNGVYLFSTFGAFIYSIVGRVPFVWAFTMILFGLGTVYNVYKGTLLITDDYKKANKAAWIACLFPNLAVLSVLVLREAPIHFFLTLAVIHIIKFIKFNNKKSLGLFFVYGLIATILHSAIIAIFAGFALVTVFSNNKIGLAGKMFVLILMLVGLYFINSTGIGLSKFGGSFEGALEQLGEQLEHKDSGALYPDWLLLSGSFSDLWKIPIRVIAFLFGPFIPFMAKTGSHLIGVFDGICYFMCFYTIFKNRNRCLKNKMSRAILLIVITISVAFSLGSSNFGTNIRHRAKVLPILLMIVFVTDYKMLNKDKQVYI